MTSASTDRDVPAAYPVPAEFAVTANADVSLSARATADREGFWAEQANRLHWHQSFTKSWTGPTHPSPDGSTTENSTPPTTRNPHRPRTPQNPQRQIMRRLLRDIAEGRELGDTSTLVDPTVFESIARR
ncbi:hypothetical protein OG225_03915 [Nocardia sp. NBC_01377]